jgi:hypothetical protein
MIQLIIPSIVTFLIFSLTIPAFSGALDHRTMHRYHQIGSPYNQGPIYPINGKNRQLIIPWKQKTKKYNHKHHPYRFIYDPRVYFYGNRDPEQKENVEINIIIDENEKVGAEEAAEEKERTYSPPHIFNLNDSGPDQTDKHLRSAESTNSVIAIHGTSVSEIKPFAD